ncbi:hypothetical protein MKAN_28280 [Mycobacterium kansasii ATCC 12478]|uniref:Uncharacterized protein n=1 Tax=Mycobacterium kansasii ATCC 12478 TaxID=557599 RepID=U5X022_MYCKA|nr:hypothetical protein MKAN_28280 [Mycobacterium kansasii ATCC 12478]
MHLSRRATELAHRRQAGTAEKSRRVRHLNQIRQVGEVGHDRRAGCGVRIRSALN